MFANAMNDARSMMRSNLEIIKSEWGGLEAPSSTGMVTPEGCAVQELLEVREGRATLGLNSDDIDQLMLTVCMR